MLFIPEVDTVIFNRFIHLPPPGINGNLKLALYIL